MAMMKGIFLAFVLVSLNGATSETSTNQDEKLLQSLMDQAQSPLEKRGHRPNWKKHPLYPLYSIDFPECKDSEREKKFGLCDSWEAIGFCKTRKSWMKSVCPQTCGFCKAFAAPACSKSPFGCCWDNRKAFGPDSEGCAPCLDIYPETCPQFKNYCFRKGKNALFVRYHCFQTCGRCDKRK